MRHIFILLVILILILSSCSSPNKQPEKSTLSVFAAASLTDAFTEIGEEFKSKHPDIEIAFNFGGSPNLRTQIEQGAQADIFASASSKEIDALISQGMIATGDPQFFATNELIVALPQANPAHIGNLADLARPDVKLVLAAEDVPAGKYARQSLEKLNSQYGADFSQRVLANVVSNEDNVRQVVAKVQLGEADAGIVYISDIKNTQNIQGMEIPHAYNITANYPISSLLKSKNDKLAKDFIDFVQSTEGQAILAKWGFATVKK